ncbi:putative lipase [Pantoea coffeiphila]|nr:putative lipase [Pantoea coffeiphila]
MGDALWIYRKMSYLKKIKYFAVVSEKKPRQVRGENSDAVLSKKTTITNSR